MSRIGNVNDPMVHTVKSSFEHSSITLFDKNQSKTKDVISTTNPNLPITSKDDETFLYSSELGKFRNIDVQNDFNRLFDLAVKS